MVRVPRHALPLLLSLALGAGCQCGSPQPIQRGPTVSASEARTFALAVNVPFAELQVPADSRNGAAPPETIALRGPFTEGGETRRGLRKWTMPVPFRSRGLFFHRAQPGMVVRDAKGAEVPYNLGGGPATRVTWSHDRENLTIYLPKTETDPSGRYTLTYPRATEREAALNRAFSGAASDEDFVRTAIYDDWDTRQGLLIPAPGVVAWDLLVPPAAEFQFSPGIVAPEMQDEADSDGVTLRVEIISGDQTTEVLRQELSVGGFEQRRIDLAAYAGKQVRLRVTTEPKANSSFDYAFLAEPVVASRREDPKRVVIVFVDTLRPDHLGPYGYERGTTPNLSRFAEDAAIFDQARSVAPWTLPSSRTMVTGKQPEYYDAPNTRTLQGALRERGWATAMFAGNVYLSANFNMHRDWEHHRASLFPSATETTDLALGWLAEHDTQDALLLVHYMDAHLPYQEPAEYRYKFAGAGPDGLPEEFARSHVVRLRDGDEADRQYVRDRYDNNIGYVDAELARLFAVLSPNDTVVFLSDHGEEFWDHGGFEHGHTVFDELLHIPMIIRSPSLPAGHVTAPVSMLDVTPTILDVIGEPQALEVDGRSLIPLARKDAGVEEAFSARDIAFGRPLYGHERWGVLSGEYKWTTTEGRESLFNLGADPREYDDLADNKRGDPGAALRARLGPAMGTETGVGYRILPSVDRTSDNDLEVALSVPGGIKAAWVGGDPLRRSSAEVLSCDGGVAKFRFHGAYSGTREVYVVPYGSFEQVSPGVLLTASQAADQVSEPIQQRRQGAMTSTRLLLARASLPSRTVNLYWGIAPIPTPGMVQLDVADSETDAMLTAMGYRDPEAGSSSEPAAPKPEADTQAEPLAPTGDAVGEAASDGPLGRQACWAEPLTAEAAP